MRWRLMAAVMLLTGRPSANEADGRLERVRSGLESLSLLPSPLADLQRVDAISNLI